MRAPERSLARHEPTRRPEPSVPVAPRGHVEALLGDCAEVLKQFPAGSIDVIISDPPFGIGFAIWDEAPSLAALRELFRILKPGGRLVFILDTRIYDQRVSDLMSVGFVRHDMAIWAYATGRPMSPSRPRPSFSPIAVVAKPGNLLPVDIEAARIPYRNATDRQSMMRARTFAKASRVKFQCSSTRPYQPSESGRHPTNMLATDAELLGLSPLFQIPRIRGKGRHPTAKPVELYAQLMRLYSRPGACVLDPFAGGGTAGVAALATGRSAVVVERAPEFHDLLLLNVEKARRGDYGMLRVTTPPRREISVRAVKHEAHAPYVPTTCLVTAEEIARQNSMSQRTLRRLRLKIEIPVVPIGERGVRFDPNDVRKALVARVPRSPAKSDDAGCETTGEKTRLAPSSETNLLVPFSQSKTAPPVRNPTPQKTGRVSDGLLQAIQAAADFGESPRKDKR